MRNAATLGDDGRLGATSRRQCGAGLDPTMWDVPPKLYYTPCGCTDGINKNGIA